MPGKGARYTWIDTVNEIRRNLQDRYPDPQQDGFTIIKEIIQNAEDARARVLDIGWMPGFPSAAHPLLRTPALFFLNDGEFKESDADAIRRLGSSRKQDEQYAIGKFGLGLKSVFHVCEAFFYVAHTSSEPTILFDIFNPWSGDDSDPGPYPEWDVLQDEDRDCIVAYLQRLPAPFAQAIGFCLWVPLRRREHYGNNDPMVRSAFDDLDHPPPLLTGPDLASRLAQVLSLLTSLTTVRLWCDDGAGPLRRGCVGLTDRPQRLRCLAAEASAESQPFAGAALVWGPEDSTPTRVDFAGWEAVVRHNAFDSLKASEHWPKLYVDFDRGRMKSTKDKAEPHVAVCFTRQLLSGEDPGPHGKLTIARAVFLPVGDPLQEVPCRGGSTYTLTLHGYFFLTPGRNAICLPEPINRRPRSESDLAGEWNRRLWDEGLLPGILPALDQFVTAAGLDVEEVRAVTDALADSELFRKSATQICSQHQWAYCVAPGGGTWRLLPRQLKVLALPNPAADSPEAAWRVFPALAHIAAEHPVTYDGWPLLAADRPAPWPPETFLRLLHDIPVADVFATDPLLEYLVRALEKAPSSPDVEDRLFNVARAALRDVPLANLRDRQERVQRFFKRAVPETRRLPLKTGGADPAAVEAVVREFLNLPLSILPLPEDLAPVDSPDDRAQLQTDDAIQMLAALAAGGGGADDSESFRSTIALQLIEDVAPGERSRLLAAVSKRPLFVAHDCADRQEVALTWAELERTHKAQMLFHYGGGARRDRGLADLLQQALAQDRVLVVDQNAAEVLFGGASPRTSACNEDACAGALGRGPLLGGPAKRRDLLERLAASFTGPPSRPDLARCIRYLLHGQRDRVDSPEPLLVERDAEGREVWAGVARQALGPEGEWRVVPRELAAVVPEARWRDLGLEPIDRQAVVRLLRQVGPEAVACDRLSEEERDTLLREIDDWNVLKGLALHLDLEGTLRPIDNRTYLESNVPIDPLLRPEVHIIRRHRTLASKQERFIPPWTAERQIAVALEQPQVPWRPVLEALATLETVKSLNSEVREKLTRTPWLPLEGGGTATPRMVLYLPDLQDTVTRVAAASGGAVASPEKLLPALREHRACRVAAELFSTGEDALERLGKLIQERSELHEWRIGALPRDRLEGALDTFLGVFGDADDLMPARRLLEYARRAISPATCRRLLEAVLGPVPMERLIRILEFLTRRHEASQRSGKDAVLELFNLYLECAANSRDFPLSKVRLLNRAGDWKPPTELCDGIDGVDGKYLLDRGQAGLVRRHIALAEEGVRQAPNEAPDPRQGRISEERLAESVQRLTHYFARWEGGCRPEVIGGFLGILGDYPALRELARHYLGNRDITSYRERLDWKPLPPGMGGAGEEANQMMAQQQFLVDIEEQREILVRNLLGQPWRVKLTQEIEHLLVGRPEVVWGRTSRIRLRALDPAAHTPEQLSGFLKETARLILQHVYQQEVGNLDEVWRDLEESEQLDIAVSQGMVLRHMFSAYLRQLGLQGHPSWRQLLERWERASRQQVEARQMDDGRRRRLESQADEAMRQVEDEARELLESQPDTQAACLEAVRQRIEHHYQYRRRSVLFELFQNADDALVELEEMYQGQGRPLEDGRREFVVHWAPDRVVVVHRGRPINAYRAGEFDGRSRGFDADLEKMLVFFASDKEASAGRAAVTGKFGLGFKSVYLLTDRPRVLSADLRFEVVGGMYPLRLVGEDYGAWSQRLGLSEQDARNATLIDLPLRPGLPDVSEEVVEPFRQLVPILLVFSRAIKELRIVSASGGEQRMRWKEKPVGDARSVYAGVLPASHRAGAEPDSGLLLRGDSGALLLLVGPRGFRPLPADVPTVWVTTPTEERANLGIAVNGLFDVDPGRANLARASEQNTRLADALGREAGEALAALFRLSEAQWDACRDVLRIASDVSPYGFWSSLWKVLTEDFAQRVSDAEAPAVALVRRVLWSAPTQGMARLISACAAIPSGLWAAYETLTARSRIRYAVRGCLDADEQLFRSVSEWPSFRRLVEPGQVVSTRRTLDPLNALWRGAITPAPLDLDLARLIDEDVGPERIVDPERAGRFGQVDKWLEQLDRKDHSEYERVRETLDALQFRARDGSHRPARELLVVDDTDLAHAEETARARFAPPSRVLAQGYRGEALAFFRLCRKRFEAPVDLLADWARQAATDEAKKAVLEYLTTGELRAQLVDTLRCRVPGTWLAELRGSALLHAAVSDARERYALLVQLGLATPPDSPSPPPVLSPDPGDALRRIDEWWRQNRGEQLQQYERTLYPNGWPRLLSKDHESIREDVQRRAAWLELFIAGATFTLGRTQPEQHREFLRRLEHDGSLRLLATPPDQRDLAAWMNLVIQYLDSRTQWMPFFHWMRLFASMVQLAYWLDDYVQWFCHDIEHQRAAIPLDTLLAGRTAPGAPDAPPLIQAVGMGASFILRELVRHGVLTNPHLDRHCYVPTGRVRTLLRWLGCADLEGEGRTTQPQIIHEFLLGHLGDRATFGRDFDIPLWIVASNHDLQRWIFRTEIPDDPEIRDGDAS